MVKERIKNKRKVFECEECCMTYLHKDMAKKCETWCKKHKSCNLEITKYAIERR
ncbi:MAG: hypothetical protein AABX59_00405 [Nanoarchaeota archaeon]